MSQARIHHGKNPQHPDFPHGQHAGYRAGCRCTSCREANNAFKRVYHALAMQRPEYAAKKRASKARFRKTAVGQAIYRASNAKRKALVKSQDIKISALIRRIYASCPLGYEVDHIKPLSRGGAHFPTNLQYLPQALNNRKRAAETTLYDSQALHWQDIFKEPSEAIPSGSTDEAIASGSAQPLSDEGEDMVRSLQ